MKIAGILGFPLLMLALGIAFGGDFSTLNASIAVPPRYLFTMARDGAVPQIFAKVHPKYKTPYVSIIALGTLSIALIATDSLIYIASLSLFADLFYYVIGIAAALGLRIKHKELNRPYRAPGITIGAPVSVLIYIVMMTQLPPDALLTGIVWCALGLLIYCFCRKRYAANEDEALSSQILLAETPSAEEMEKMDREYKIWRRIVAVAVVIAAAIYALPFSIG